MQLLTLIETTFRRWAVFSEVRRELGAYSARELADLGIRRSEIAAIAMEDLFDELDAPMVRVTGKDVPLPYAANLEKLALPTPDDIVDAARGICQHAYAA